MGSESKRPDLEQYRLTVETADDHTLQLVRGSTTNVNTWQKWKRRRHLGSGGFGDVWREGCEDEYLDWNYRAVKVCSEWKMQAYKIDYKRELSTLAAFSNSKAFLSSTDAHLFSNLFVNLHGWWIDSGNVFVAMEYLRFGDLSKYTTGPISEAETREIIDNILQGLEVMHQEGYAHRDIKPENILVVEKFPEFPRWRVKIGDFGISKQVVEGSNTALYTAVGTSGYCAPEILGFSDQIDQSSYSTKVDLWSLGCVLFKVSSQGHLPFSGLELVRYCDGTVPLNSRKIPTCLDADGLSLLTSLLQVSPEHRPTATEALQHPWLTELHPTISHTSSSPLHSPPLTGRQNFNSFLDSPYPTTSPLGSQQWHSNASATNVPQTDLTAQRLPIHTRNNGGKQVPDLPPRPQLPSIEPVKDGVATSALTVPSTEGTVITESEPKTAVSPQVGPEDDIVDPTLTPKISQSGSLPLNEWFMRNETALKEARHLGQQPLHVAASKGQLDIVNFLLNEGADIHATSDLGATPLQLAVAEDHLAVAKLLKERGADINARISSGSTLMYSSAWHGRLTMAEWLLEQGLDIHTQNNSGWSPMHAAATNGHVDMSKWLLKQGASVGVLSQTGWTPLHGAAHGNRLEMVKWLVQQKADFNVLSTGGFTPLDYSVTQGHFEVVKWLHGQGADIHAARGSSSITPLYSAASNGRLELVKFLVGQNADPNVQATGGWTALFGAVNGGHLEVVKWLKDQKGVDIHAKRDSDGATPLYIAAGAGRLEVVKWLVGQQVDINILATSSGWPPLYNAANSGHLEVVKWLHGQGADILTRSKYGWAAIHTAAISNQLEIVKWLVGQGADVKLKTYTQETALSLAQGCKHVELEKWLIEQIGPSSTSIGSSVRSLWSKTIR